MLTKVLTSIKNSHICKKKQCIKREVVGGSLRQNHRAFNEFLGRNNKSHTSLLLLILPPLPKLAARVRHCRLVPLVTKRPSWVDGFKCHASGRDGWQWSGRWMWKLVIIVPNGGSELGSGGSFLFSALFQNAYTYVTNRIKDLPFSSSGQDCVKVTEINY